MDDLHPSHGKDDHQTASTQNNNKVHGIAAEHSQPIFDEEERQNPKRRKLEEAEQIEGTFSSKNPHPSRQSYCRFKRLGNTKSNFFIDLHVVKIIQLLLVSPKLLQSTTMVLYNSK